MMVLDGRLDQRRRRLLAAREKRMAAFHDAPAGVVPLLHKIRLFPQILAVLARARDARSSCRGTCATDCGSRATRFRAGRRHIDERIVLGDRIRLARLGMIDIDAQHLGQQRRHVLADDVGVGIGGAVAGGDVEHAVVAEDRGAAVMAVGGDFDDGFFRAGDDVVGRPGFHRVADDAGLFLAAVVASLAEILRPVAADVNVAVLGPFRMEFDLLRRCRPNRARDPRI